MPETLQGYTVSDLLDQLGAVRIDLFKIDIEGDEQQIFQHAERSWLDRVRAIIVETHGPLAHAVVMHAMPADTFTHAAIGEKHVFIRKPSA